MIIQIVFHVLDVFGLMCVLNFSTHLRPQFIVLKNSAKNITILFKVGGVGSKQRCIASDSLDVNSYGFLYLRGYYRMEIFFSLLASYVPIPEIVASE